MEKRITCRLVGYDCDFMIRDESEEVLLKEYADHLEKIHRTAYTKEVRDKVQALIREAA